MSEKFNIPSWVGMTFCLSVFMFVILFHTMLMQMFIYMDVEYFDTWPLMVGLIYSIPSIMFWMYIKYVGYNSENINSVALSKSNILNILAMFPFMLGFANLFPWTKTFIFPSGLCFTFGTLQTICLIISLYGLYEIYTINKHTVKVVQK